MSVIEAALKCEKHWLLRDLDPSRSEDAECRFPPEWFRASDPDVVFGHAHISPHFLHGTSRSLDSTIQELLDGRTKSESFPALVAIQLSDNKKFVICGNRRLKCLKTAWSKGKGSDFYFKMIVHRFPLCSMIKDQRQRCLFKLKAILAMNTLNSGQDAHVRKSRRVA